MKIKIKIPHRVGVIGTASLNWINVPIWQRNRIDFRRIDVLLLVLCAATAAHQGYFYGWMGALKGAVMFGVFMVLAFVIRQFTSEL